MPSDRIFLQKGFRPWTLRNAFGIGSDLRLGRSHRDFVLRLVRPRGSVLLDHNHRLDCGRRWNVGQRQRGLLGRQPLRRHGRLLAWGGQRRRLLRQRPLQHHRQRQPERQQYHVHRQWLYPWRRQRRLPFDASITASNDATINSVIDGGQWHKRGAGTLPLGASTLTPARPSSTRASSRSAPTPPWRYASYYLFLNGGVGLRMTNSFTLDSSRQINFGGGTAAANTLDVSTGNAVTFGGNIVEQGQELPRRPDEGRRRRLGPRRQQYLLRPDNRQRRHAANRQWRQCDLGQSEHSQ